MTTVNGNIISVALNLGKENRLLIGADANNNIGYTEYRIVGVSYGQLCLTCVGTVLVVIS